MALILNKEMWGKRCWACGQQFESNKPAILYTGVADVICMHPNCAKSISQQLLRDLAQLIDLGYEDKDE